MHTQSTCWNHSHLSTTYGPYGHSDWQSGTKCLAIDLYTVDISGTMVGGSPDCLLLSGTVVGENPDHVCWVVNMHLICIHVPLVAGANVWQDVKTFPETCFHQEQPQWQCIQNFTGSYIKIYRLPWKFACKLFHGGPSAKSTWMFPR